MVAISGLFARSDAMRKTVAPMPLDIPAAPPVDHVVIKDGKPFAILNATPQLAERTLAGFVRSTPGSQWTLARC